MAERLVIYGNGQMAEFAFARFRQDQRYEVVAFTVDRAALHAPTLHGLSVTPFEDIERTWPPDAARLFIAVGPVQANRISAERFLHARRMGYRFASFVSAHALIDPSVVLGENLSLGDNVVIGPHARLGDNVRVGTGSVIGHHCVLEDHCYLSINCTISGSVRIGERALVGAGAAIRDRVAIGTASIVGIGATIVRDTAPESVHVAPDAVELSIRSGRVQL